MIELIAMTSEGDTKFTFDNSKELEVDQARIVFREFKDKGYSAFSMGGDGVNTPISEFDGVAGTVLFIPMLTGG